MPFSSPAQRKFLFIHHPDIANKWVREEKNMTQQSYGNMLNQMLAAKKPMVPKPAANPWLAMMKGKK